MDSSGPFRMGFAPELKLGSLAHADHVHYRDETTSTLRCKRFGQCRRPLYTALLQQWSTMTIVDIHSIRLEMLVYWLALNISLTQRIVVETWSVKDIKSKASTKAKRAETRGRKPHCPNRRTHPLRVAGAPRPSCEICDTVGLLIV